MIVLLVPSRIYLVAVLVGGFIHDGRGIQCSACRGCLVLYMCTIGRHRKRHNYIRIFIYQSSVFLGLELPTAPGPLGGVPIGVIKWV